VGVGGGGKNETLGDLKESGHINGGPNFVDTEGEEEEEAEENEDKKMQLSYGKIQNSPPTLISYLLVFQTAL